MWWYAAFNGVEAVLWFLVSAVILVHRTQATGTRRRALVLAVVSFVLFGISDLIEASHADHYPLWLWGFKIACGAGILISRWMWLGPQGLTWRSREVVFAVSCLLTAIIIIGLQNKLQRQQVLTPTPWSATESHHATARSD